MLWQILRADNVFVRFYFATLLAVITVYAVEILLSLYVPSAVLTKLARKFQTKHLGPVPSSRVKLTRMLTFDLTLD